MFATAALLSHLNQCLDQHFGAITPISRAQPETGGDINTCFSFLYGSRRLFAKTHSGQQAPAMLQAEFTALETFGQLKLAQCPQPIITGTFDGQAYLVMGYLALGSQRDWPALAQALCELHSITAPEFGWPQDNFIGSTPQSNSPNRQWSEFWREQRLRPQLTLALSNGYGHELRPRIASLLQASDQLLQRHSPRAALVHGDLWSGNVAFTQTGQPALYDPAAYFGDREVDLAMTELFGGFAPEFYHAYCQQWPLDAGYQQRKKLYNLYHLLNHLNLFGAGYLGQCLSSIDDIINACQPASGCQMPPLK